MAKSFLVLFFKKELLLSFAMLIPGVQAEGQAAAILARLQKLYPTLIDLSLGRIQRLLAALGDPQTRLPPVIHVAGTNGKGSVCAFLRAIGEASGRRVHVGTSPHLVRLNERFRVAGTLVSDAALLAVLHEIEAVNAGAPITVFEVLTAAAYQLFSRTPADLCVVEVGLGGRFDATNVIDAPAACVITSLSLDHQDFLGDRLDRIAWEKAGIMKPGRPVVTGAQAPEALGMLRQEANAVGARLLVRGEAWDFSAQAGRLAYRDGHGALDLPAPGLLGAHQAENAGLAVAALRAAGLGLDTPAYAGIAAARWPARMQRLTGALAASLPAGFELWLDGGHNEAAGAMLAGFLASHWADRPAYVLVGMKTGKNAAGFLRPLQAQAAGVWAVREPGQHLALGVDEVIAASGGVAREGPDVRNALAQVAARPPGRVLICGSLYLAGEVLKLDGALPD
jgi:dihydrofolate synthase / folylpolyglutamate synthase